MKFNVIVSDPPWLFTDSLSMDETPRGAAANYPLLDVKELCKLKVKELADPEGCILVLWSIGSLLDDAMEVMKAWGFKQKQVFVWQKTKQQPLESLKKAIRKHKKLSGAALIQKIEEEIDTFDLNETSAFGMGRLFRQTHEICLVGINSTKIYKQLKNKSQRSVSIQPATKHSKKPEDLQDRLDQMFPDQTLNRLEMFARRERPGWVCLGNEIGLKEDIRDSIDRLIAGNVQSTPPKR